MRLIIHKDNEVDPSTEGGNFSLIRERIRQIEVKALRKPSSTHSFAGTNPAIKREPTPQGAINVR